MTSALRSQRCSLVLGGLFCVLLASCSSVQKEPQPAPREQRQASDNADPERRAQLRLELAGMYFARGQTATALDEVQQALSAKPNLPEAYGLRGLIYASMGDIPKSEDSFKRALDMNGRDADTMQNYGWVLCQQQRYAEADALFERALAQPQYRETQRTLLAQGVCHARAGRWGDSERTLSRSYELDPGNPVTAFNLSEVLLRRGELERARFYVARINAVSELSSAQSLWLAARIERRIGNLAAVQGFGRQLLDRFPQSPEALQYEKGRFDD
jgi:type IV pilus assembly protein PilF